MSIKVLKIVALIFPGLTIVILLLFAVAETTGGDWSGLGHLIQAAPIGLLMWLGWKRPLWGSIFFLLLSLLVAYFFGNTLPGPAWLGAYLIIVLPLFLSGLLLLGTAGLERKLTAK